MCILHNFQKNKLMGLSRSRIQSFLKSFERLFKNLKSSALPCINFSSILNISKEKENWFYHFLFDIFLKVLYPKTHMQLTTTNANRYLLSTTTPLENQRIPEYHCTNTKPKRFIFLIILTHAHRVSFQTHKKNKDNFTWWSWSNTMGGWRAIWASSSAIWPLYSKTHTHLTTNANRGIF